MIQIKRYKELKESGKLTIEKVGSAYSLTRKRFDTETGEELMPEQIAVDLDELKAQAAEFRASALIIDEFISDLEALR
jgi:hypothetical protein